MTDNERVKQVFSSSGGAIITGIQSSLKTNYSISF